MRAAIYTRISEDTEGLGEGVARQEDDCRQLCQRKGWQVVEVYQDNDRSAFSGKPRERYEQLLEDVKAGVVDVIVCWHPDRLHRSPKELERFIELLEVAQVTVATVCSGDRDFSTPDGRSWARIEGALARRESEHKSERITRKHLQLVEKGTYVGGGRRPFGYTWAVTDKKRTGLKIEPTEAKLIKDAAARVLRGESLYSIVNRWNDEVVPTVTGTPWSTGTLRQILTSGRVAGWRDHHGQPVKQSGEWKAVLDEKTWDDVRKILLDPARKRTKVARKYLLGQGQLRCGSCGGKLVAAPQKDKAGQSVRRYACKTDRFGGCGQTSALAEPVEQIVSAWVKQALSDPEFLARLTGEADRDDSERAQRANVAEMEASLEEAANDYYVGKVISRAEFLKVRDQLVPSLDAARALLASTARRRPLAVLAGLDSIEAQWDGLSLDRQQALIDLCIQSVTIASANRRARAGYFDASRVQAPVWRV